MKQRNDLWLIARNAAFRVEFITTGREILLYANVIYSAMMWGWNEKLKKIDSLKEKDLLTLK